MPVTLGDGEVLVLTKDDLMRVLEPRALIDTMRSALIALTRDARVAPARTMVAARSGALVLMPAYGEHWGKVGAKVLTVMPGNPMRGLPYGQGAVLVFDVEDGRLVAIVDATYITEVRTAATSAVATDVLARPDAGSLAIIGTGIQARAHARFIPLVRPITEVRLAGRNLEKAKRLAGEIEAALQVRAEAKASYAEAIRGSDIVCGVSHNPEPSILGQLLEPGMHVNSVGLNREGREVDSEAVKRALVVVESKSSVLSGPAAGSNDLLWPLQENVITADHIYAELGELIVGRLPGRTAPSQITLFKSVGSAIEDVSTASLALECALEKGAGTRVRI